MISSMTRRRLLALLGLSPSVTKTNVASAPPLPTPTWQEIKNIEKIVPPLNPQIIELIDVTTHSAQGQWKERMAGLISQRLADRGQVVYWNR